MRMKSAKQLQLKIKLDIYIKPLTLTKRITKASPQAHRYKQQIQC